MQTYMRVLSAPALFAVLAFFTSCQKEMLEPTAAETETETGLGGGSNPPLVEFIDIDYVPSAGYYVVSGKTATGDVDTYYGTTRNWTKQRDSRDASQIKGTFAGSAFDNDPDGDGNFNFMNVSIHNGAVNTNGGFEFSGAPRSNSGGAKVGDLTEFIDVDYVPSAGYYVITGKTASGQIDTYFGTTRNWTKQRDKRDANQIKGTFVGSAFDDDPDGNGRYTFLNVSIFKGKVHSNGGYEFYGAPRSNSGGAKVGDLTEFIDVDYVPSAGYYVITGKNASGEVDTYYGTTRNWTKQSDSRDANQVKGAFVGSAFDDKEDYKFQNVGIFNGEVNTNGGFEFSGAPRYNSGGATVK